MAARKAKSKFGSASGPSTASIDIPKRRSNKATPRAVGIREATTANDPDTHPGSWVVQGVAVFAAAMILRLLHFWAMSKTVIYEVLIGDAWQYDQWAQQIAAGQWIGTEVFYQTPLYPYFLGVVYSVAGHSVWSARWLQAVLGSLACVLLARAGTRFFNYKVGWVAGLLLAAYPPAIFFDGILQKATLDLLLTSAIIWVVSRQSTRSSHIEILSLGCLLGLLILNRENAWVFFPVLLAWVIWRYFSEPNRLGGVLAVGALIGGMALTLGPVGLRNYYVGGEFLLTTSQMGPNFFIGNHRGASGRYVSLRPDRGDPRFERTDARILAEQAEDRSLTPSQVSRYWMHRSYQDIMSEPLNWVALLARKWFLTWNQVEMVDGEGIRVHSWYSPVLLGLRWFLNFGTLTAIAVMGAWLSRKRFRDLWVLLGLILSFALAVTLFFVFARYRYPLVPLVTLFAAYGLVRAWRLAWDVTRAEWQEMLVAVTLGCLAAIATCWPNRDLHNDEVTYFSVGTALNDVGRYEEAMQQFEEALKIRPKFAQAYVNMGTTAIKQEKMDLAENYLREAIRIHPQNPVALQNLATILDKKGDEAGAEKVLLQTLENDPLMIPALQTMSRILTRRGETDEAVRYMQRAVEVDRQSPQAHSELAMTLMANRQFEAAVAAFETALKLSPDNILVANNYAWVLATGPENVRSGHLAVQLATQVCEAVDFKTPEFLDTLAAALAEDGQFERAIEYAKRATELLEVSGDPDRVRPVQERLEVFRNRQSYIDPSMQ